jgi:hypothetical protein
VRDFATSPSLTIVLRTWEQFPHLEANVREEEENVRSLLISCYIYISCICVCYERMLKILKKNKMCQWREEGVYVYMYMYTHIQDIYMYNRISLRVLP